MLVSGVHQSDSVFYIYICVYVCVYIYIYIYICIHTHTHTHIHSFSDSFPIQVITEYWVEFPVLYSRSLLIIYFIYNSVYLLIPNSQFIPPSYVSPLVSINLFSMSVSLFLFCFWVCLCECVCVCVCIWQIVGNSTCTNIFDVYKLFAKRCIIKVLVKEKYLEEIFHSPHALVRFTLTEKT